MSDRYQQGKEETAQGISLCWNNLDNLTTQIKKCIT